MGPRVLLQTRCVQIRTRQNERLRPDASTPRSPSELRAAHRTLGIWAGPAAASTSLKNMPGG